MKNGRIESKQINIGKSAAKEVSLIQITLESVSSRKAAEGR